jgi:class 3 adenylate cyclase/streptogramin lyase
MAELPRGTVSLLFTDIEGSTQLQRRLGDEYQGVVESHRLLLEEAFAAHGGTVVDRQTESFFAVFSRARDAVRAAVQAQRAIADHVWPDGSRPRVRMGIHAGEPELAGDRYVGLAVSRAARICAAGHGGQVLLSSSARSLLADDDQAKLRPLGSYSLKDFSAPEPIYQVVVDGGTAKFPPLRAEKGASRRRWLLLAAALVAVAAIAGAVILSTSGSSGPKTIGPTSVGVIDQKTGKLVDEVPIGFKSPLIAAGSGFVWVVDPNRGTLTKIDPRNRNVAGTFGITVGTGDVPFGVAAGQGFVWVSVLRGSRLVVLQFSSDVSVPRTIRYGGQAQSPNVFQLQPLAVGDGAVFALDPGANAVWRLNPVTRGSRKLAEGLDARSLAYGAGGVWVGGTSNVTEIGAQTGFPLGSASIASEGFAEVASIAVGAGHVWYAASSSPTLLRIDPRSPDTRDPFTVGRGPSGIAVDNGVVWVANSRDSTVSRVDPRTGEQKTIELGQPPGGIVAANGAVWTSPGQPRS